MSEILDLGCGKWPQKDATIRVDTMRYPHVTHQLNLCTFPYPFKDNTASKIYVHDVIEHISVFEIKKVIWECYRILMPGGVLDITCPDVKWVAERIVKGDWRERAKGNWLNRYSTPFENAMSYVFGGFYAVDEWDKPGLGHIAGYDGETLIKVLTESLRSVGVWGKLSKVPDPRNECILRVLAIK